MKDAGAPAALREVPLLRSLRRDLIHTYKYLMLQAREDRARFFLTVPRDRTRGNGRKGKFRKFRVDV